MTGLTGGADRQFAGVRRLTRSAAARPDRPVLLAALAALVGSIALPWLNEHLQTGFTSVYLPGSCYLSYDGYSYCDGSSIGYGSTVTVGGPVPGTQLPIRVIAVLVALVALACYRTGRRDLLLITAGLGLFGLFDGGALVTAGRLLWVAALLTALAVLHRRVTGRNRSDRPGDQPPARRPALG